MVVKLPLTWDGLTVVQELAEQGVQDQRHPVLFGGAGDDGGQGRRDLHLALRRRLDDHGADGMELIQEIRAIYDGYDFDTEILAASIRNPAHVKAAALAGADCATIPPGVFRDLVKHPLTERGLETFISDWAKTGQSIL